MTDPATLRRFSFRDGQATLLRLLDGQNTPEQVADALGAQEQLHEIEALIAKFQHLGLIEGSASSNLRAQQAKAMRPSTRKRIDLDLVESVRWAAAQLPFYRERISDLVPEVKGIEDLIKLPITSKVDLRDNFSTGFIDSSINLSQVVETDGARTASSSGSTGGRTPSVVSPGQSMPYYFNTYGIRMGMTSDRHAIFTTPICSGAFCQRMSSYEERLDSEGRSLLIFSSERIMQLERAEIDRILSDFDRFRPDFLFVDPFYMVALVRAVQSHGLPLPKLSSIITGFEFLTNRHREILEETFDVPVRTVYGVTELNNGLAFTCENRNFHTMDTHVMEFIRDGRPVQFGEMGSLVITNLKRLYMALVRYRVGDLGTPIEDCGCQFDDLQAFSFEGRVQELLYTTDGAPVSTRTIDKLFDGLRWLDFYQFVQHSPREYRMFGVKSEEADTTQDEQEFLQRAKELLGAKAEISVEYVRELPMNASLKYSVTKNLMGPTLVF